MSDTGRETRGSGYVFGSFVLDLTRFELRRGEQRVELQPKVFAVLRLLVEAAPRTVPKEEILDTVWADVVTGDEVLTKAISQARQALSRVSPGEEVIRTVRGRGYGIALDVAPLDAAADPELEASAAAPRAPAPAEAVEPLAEAPRPPRRFGPLLVAGGIGGAALAVLVAAGVYLALPTELPFAPARPAAGPGSAPPPTAVAVLAFSDLSPEGDHTYLAHGISEDLIANLSRQADLHVAARTSAFAFADEPTAITEIGRRLGVGSVVEGSVRVVGDRLRVSAQLVRAHDGFQLWGDRFDRPLDDVLGVQDDIANQIARELEARLSPVVRSPRRDGSMQAYLLTLRGRKAILKRTPEGVDEAIELYGQAVAADPGSAEAQAGLASSLGYKWGSFSAEPRTSELLARAEEHARLAVAADPASATAHKQLAVVMEVRHRDWPAALALYDRALELNPGHHDALVARAGLLLKLGRFDEAHPLLLRAVEQDPLGASVHQMLGRLLFYRTEYDAALTSLHRSWAISTGPDIPSLLSKAYGRKGMERESSEALMLAFPPGQRPGFRILARTLGTVGFLRFMMDVVEWRTGSRCGTVPWTGSHVFAYTGEVERMLECLNEAEQRHFWYVRVEPAFDPYRKDPRFVALLERAGFGDDAIASAGH
ncbi:MAG: winged helix-turn-helix domain-containing protein [Myxococcota bacterium]|nr:winged helix-turn-helix domain-containing protein [Myxococcota bacterium]